MTRGGIAWAGRHVRGLRPELVRQLACISYLVAAAAVIGRAFAGWSYDDPYITYRYAENLIHGLGFVYNSGERVLSTTTPLFAMLLALLARVTLDLPHAAAFIGVISLAVGAYCLWDMSHVLGHPLVGWITLLLYPTFSLVLNTLGSEMPLYLAFCAMAFAWHAREHHTASACCAALATLTRPDGILLFAVLTGYVVLTRRKDCGGLVKALNSYRRPALIYVTLTSVWFLFAWAYFGTPLPATLAAKQAQGLIPISQGYLAGLVTILTQYLPVTNWLALGFAFIGLIYGAVRRNRLLLPAVWAALFVAGYATIDVSRYFWYYAPLAPGFIIVAALGIEDGYQLLRRATAYLQTVRMREGPAGPRGVLIGRVRGASGPILVSVGCVAVILLGQLGRDVELAKTGDNRIAIYRAAGEWLQAHTDPDSTVAALEIGVIGYYSYRSMIDFAGLIRPDVARQVALTGTYEDTAIWVVNHDDPDYVVLTGATFPRLQQVLLSRHCVNVQTFPGVRYGYDADMRIVQCPNA